MTRLFYRRAPSVFSADRMHATCMAALTIAALSCGIIVLAGTLRTNKRHTESWPHIEMPGSDIDFCLVTESARPDKRQ
ncbi:hypothetical protein RP726_00870 [Candidatus Methylospira mobilis]|uniref:hypothetical protein n=1 Tax=Candidatus Methylospira mobilis TaxID=1808979 RepID=UPI0028E2DE89|nr:hypothetical protein [Candidatus Methylospira mobilis]WNV04981.1 hypothetical protein RP726_00870 [Candidatus Methylospira mobilis]